MLDHMGRSTVVEPKRADSEVGTMTCLTNFLKLYLPGIEFMDDGLESDDGEETRGESDEPCESEDNERQKTR